MTPWNRALYQGWYVVAESSTLAAKPLCVTLLDRPFAIARLPSGALLALDDCCPHRHAPLSQGRITADGVQCPYHGWAFGVDGRCTAIPGLATSACLPHVQVGRAQILERDGLIWMSMHSAPAADAALLPDYLNRLPKDGLRFTWTSTWNARAVDALENFLDPLHTHFVHAGLVRRAKGRKTVTATVTQSTNGLHVDYGGQSAQQGLLYTLFESPRVLERAHFAYATPGSAQIEYRYANGSAIYFTIHCTPVSESLTRIHGTFHIENRWAPAWAVKLLAWPFLRHVARQDQKIVERQARNRSRFGRTTGISTELDLVHNALNAIWTPSQQKPVERTHTVSILL